VVAGPVIERPPRVAYILSCRGVGGAEEMVASLVEAGRAHGWQQLLLVPFASEGSTALAELCPTASWEAMPCDRAWRVPALRRWTRRTLAAFEPDLVHVTLFHAGLLIASLRREAAPRILTHAYGESIRHLSHPRARLVLDRWAVRRFDHVSAISDSVHDFLTGVHDLPASSVGRIRLGWRGEPLRREARGPGVTPTIVCVAAMRPEKGHDILLRAFEIVRRAIPGVRLVLVGDGPCRQSLEASARTAGLGDSVLFAGRVPNIWANLRDADVFALASRNEALGIAIMEAMAAGLPVVAPAVGGIPELVEPGVTGQLFAPGDHDALAGHLIDLLGSPEHLLKMSSAARQAAQGMHMNEGIRKYFELYGSLMQQRPQASATCDRAQAT